MKLETSRIKGVLRFRDEVVIDYRELPAGLIAFVGENGEGKSTTLEAPVAGLYREFPSRHDKELLDYVHGTDSFIETTFELEGQGLFRSRLNLDGPHRRADAILARTQPDGQPAMLNDGKLTTYDAEVSKYLPPKALLLASVFAAQDRTGTFSTLDRKARRMLFASLLGLDHLQEMSERAKSAAALVQQAIDRVATLRDVLARDTGETVEAALEQRARQLQTEGGDLEVRRVELQRDLTAIEAELSALQESATAFAAARARADRLEVELAAARGQAESTAAALRDHTSSVESERRHLLASTEASLEALDRAAADRSTLEAELAGIAQVEQAIHADADKRIAGNRTLLDHAAEIREAVAVMATAEARLAQLRTEERTHVTRLEELRRGELSAREALHAIRLAEQDLARARADAGLLDDVPCGGAGEFTSCQFLTNASAARASMPHLEATAGTRATVEADLQRVMDALTDSTDSLAEVRRAIAAAERDRAALKPTADRLADVTAAEQKIASHTERKQQASDDAVRQRMDAQRREDDRVRDLRTRRAHREEDSRTLLARLDARAAARQEELTAATERLSAAIEASVAERAALIDELALTRDAGERAAEQQALLALRRREWDDTATQLGRVTHAREELAHRRAEFDQRRAELARVDGRLRGLQTDLIEWRLLERALGRDGLQTIEIDEAGPTVSKLTNDLLESSYGSRFTLELVTQEPLRKTAKDGTGFRDVFEARVFDTRDGGEARDIGDLSGGEKVIVEEALKSAIAVFVNLRNPHPIRTCWRDETTGALNADNALRYMAMLRRVHQIGGFHHTIFITHNQDAALLADAQVLFADGRVEVRFPPYEPRQSIQEESAAA